MLTTIEKICRTCKFPFSFPTAEATFACPACGAVNGRPQAEGMSYDCLKRATNQRLGCDFHNAVSSYQHVLLDYPDEHEALWGLTLCRYGVEYVEDPRSGTLMPTVHSVRRRPMQADKDFLNACEQAPENVRAQYEAEAAYIDDAMARIRELAQTQKPYDVFICHKTTRPDSGDPTWECLRASEMAHQLEKQGYRVFFAPEAMKGEIGADYEAAIYHALDTAKVLLLLCAEPDYVTSPWVRSEWTRFLEMTDEREDKRLVPLLYGDFTPAKLPRELRPYRLECVTMDSFTAASDILRHLEKCCGKRGEEEKAETVEEKPAPVQPAPEKPAPVPENPVTEMKNAPVQSVPTYAPETDFVTEAVLGGCAITKYRGKGGEVNVPPTIGGRKVVEIGREAFMFCSSLTSITLPEGVTSIGDRVFYDCSSLTRVVLPDSIGEMKGNPFDKCGSLVDISVSPSHPMLSVVDGVLFDKNKKQLICYPCSLTATHYDVPLGVTSIGNFAFDYCSSLTSITLPESIREIRNNPFGRCEKLREISVTPSHGMFSVVDGVLFDKQEQHLICCPCALEASHYEVPFGVTSIGEYAFCDCKGLKNITLPGSVTSIGECAFWDCKGLENITLPDGVTSIGDGMFWGCSSLTSIKLPKGVKSIGDRAFYKCSSLTSIMLPKGLTSIGDWAFCECRSLTSITLPEGVTSIEGRMFSDCSSLTSITLPKSLMSIDDYAFWGCSSLRSIALPRRLQKIGYRAFDGCDKLPLSLKLKLMINEVM